MLTAVNLMLFSLLHNPCATTIMTIYKETGSRKWATIGALMPLSIAFIVTFITASLARLLGRLSVHLEAIMEFQRTYSGAPWEAKVGYCRALRAGDHIYVTGTAPVDENGGCFAPGDAYAQAQRCFEIMRGALQNLGADLNDVVRTRMFVTDISRWQEYGRAHGEIFASHPPATTMVEVKALIDPQMLIEIEADAICLERQN